MQKNSTYRHAVRGVWQHGHAAYASWPAETRALVQASVDDLVASLADADREDELIDRYMALHGSPYAVARHSALPKPTLLAAAAVEDECFWRRAAEIERSAIYA